MRSMWTRGLAVALGLVASAHAQNAPIATIGRPVAATIGRPVALPSAAQPAALDRPVARIEGPVKPVSFDRPVVRGVSPDPTPAKPMPTGPGTDPGVLGMYGWTRPEEPTTAPAVVAAPPLMVTAATAGGPGTPILPAPTASPLPSAGPIVTGPIATGPMIGGPVVASPGHVVGVPMGNCDPCPTVPCPGGSAACSPGAACGGIGVCADGGGRDPFSNRWYVGAEYLLWTVRGDPTPALVTVAPPGGNPALAPGTVTLFGGESIGDSARSGGRLTAGYWFGDNRCLGLEIGGFFLSEQVTTFTATGNEFGPVIGRPFFNIIPAVSPTTGAVIPPGEQAEIVAGTPVGSIPLAGAIYVRHTSSLWGYEVNLKRNLWNTESIALDALVGYRQLGLDESLSITENLVLPGSFPVSINDRFSTTNRFYGAQIGLSGEVWLWERVSLTGFTKVGLGYTNARVTIDGSTSAPLAGVTGAGGLLTGPGNIGHTSRDGFSVVPEVGATLGYYVTDWMRLSVGYNFLYWNNVARPGEQIDRRVNLNNAFGSGATTAPLVPQSLNTTSNFWAHGLTLGLEFRF